MKPKVIVVTSLLILSNFVYFFFNVREGVVHSSSKRTPGTFIARESQVEITELINERVEEIRKDINDSFLIKTENLPGNILSGEYIIESSQICKDVDIVDMIFLVHSAPANFQKRENIRKTYANKSLFLPRQVRVAFILGLTQGNYLKRELILENNKYHDSVIGDFIDHYRNLSVKGVLGFRWVSEHCSNARFVVENDDDVIVNTYKILTHHLHQFSQQRKTIFGNQWDKDTMPILRQGKWGVQPHVFQGMEVYPYTYCSGFFVIFTTDLMNPLYQASKVTPFFWVSDIYLSGMLPSVVGNVTFKNHPLDKYLSLDEPKTVDCYSKLGKNCSLFAIGNTNYDHFWSMWNLFKFNQ